MKNFLLAACILLMVGCGTLNEKYVDQDRRNFETLAPRVRVLMDTSDHYTEDQEQDIEDRLQMWGARLTQAESATK